VSATETAGSTLRELLRAYHQAWFRYHPDAAVDAGVEGYAHLLTPYDDEARGALVCLNDELLVALEELTESALDPDDGIDLALARGGARLENERLLDLDPRRADPERLLPVNAVYQLTIRPVADFAGALMARLSTIPAHLDGARHFLSPRAAHVPALWLRSAVASARHGVEFLRGLPACPKFDGSAPAGLEAAIAAAEQALLRFADFLEKETASHAHGEVACGEQYFRHLLRERHFLDVSPDVLYAFGERLVDETRRELRDACRELTGSGDLSAALARLHAEHPSAERLLDVYRDSMRAARAFVAQHGLVTLPARECLDVVETPVFLRNQIPFAAYCDPAPNDPEQRGLYYVTPPQDAEQLAEHDNTGLMNTCAHEAWPGHHLHFATVNGNPAARTLPRLLHASATCYEGWALYSEQLMHEAGFLDRPGSRVLLLRDRLWRALRILIDVEIHTRGVSPERAAQRLVEELGFPRSQAMADVTWYTRSPTVPLGYAAGWALINALRDRWSTHHPDGGLKEFHDRLLSVGAIALPLVIQRAFGDADWLAVRDRVFGSGAVE
jgi:uncharacterized protein (DUF885 family)